MGDGDLRTLLTGARLLLGWAFIAVAALDLVTGFQAGAYLVFHLVLLAGGLLLLQKPLRPLVYAVIAVLAVVSVVVAALPSSEQACCMHGLDVRHGYPLSVVGWNLGRAHQFAAVHAVADLVFWFLVWMTVGFGVYRFRGRRLEGRESDSGRQSEGRQSEGRQSEGRQSEGRRSEGRRLPHPVSGGPSTPPGSDNSASSSTAVPSSTEGAPSTPAPVADDESVGGLP
jgi:hypothetical protein